MGSTGLDYHDMPAKYATRKTEHPFIHLFIHSFIQSFITCLKSAISVYKTYAWVSVLPYSLSWLGWGWHLDSDVSKDGDSVPVLLKGGTT